MHSWIVKHLASVFHEIWLGVIEQGGTRVLAFSDISFAALRISLKRVLKAIFHSHVHAHRIEALDFTPRFRMLSDISTIVLMVCPMTRIRSRIVIQISLNLSFVDIRVVKMRV